MQMDCRKQPNQTVDSSDKDLSVKGFCEGKVRLSLTQEFIRCRRSHLVPACTAKLGFLTAPLKIINRKAGSLCYGQLKLMVYLILHNER